MKIKSAKFILSSSEIDSCPPPNLPEYAFIGRSNVGKSSLINMITERNSLAKTSNKPGKTKLINHFSINQNWLLADLPGYGYAKVSKKERSFFLKLIKTYLTKRVNLICTFLLLDIRIKPQVLDLNFMKWMNLKQLPFVLVFTKSDKLKNNILNSNLNIYIDKLNKTWEELPKFYVTSSKNKIGKNEILRYIDVLNSKISPDFF